MCEEETTQHDNDADARPRIYIHAENSDGKIDVTVQGSEKETTEEIEEKAKEMVGEAIDAEKELHNGGENPPGYQ